LFFISLLIVDQRLFLVLVCRIELHYHSEKYFQKQIPRPLSLTFLVTILGLNPHGAC
jgi:hypothetical protein